MELLLNGRSLGVQQMSSFPDHVITWYVPYEKGQLKAIARNDGKVMAEYELNTTGVPAQLLAENEHPVLKANRQDVTGVAVYIADDQQRHIYLPENKITVQVTGPVKLLGLENANANDTSRYAGNSRNAFRGRMKVYVQALGKPGHATVTISSPGLKDAVVPLLIE